MTNTNLTRELAEVLQCPERVAALEARIERLERQEREAVAPECGSDHAGPRMLRMRAVESRVGLSRQTIYRRIAAGEFPKQVPLGGSAVGWLDTEVDKWLDGLHV